MGLDNFWKMSDDSKPPSMLERSSLCGGMLSGADSASFRGKVYDSLVVAVTSESLYQEEISNEVVRQMTEKLEAFKPEQDGVITEDGYRYHISLEEVEAITRNFRHHADLGCSLVGWW